MKRTKGLICLCLSILMALICLPGCHTVHGAGEDIEGAGEAIQDSAD